MAKPNNNKVPKEELSHFPFYRSFLEAIDELEDKERLSLYDGMAKYAFYGLEYRPTTKDTRIAWTLIKPNLDSTILKVLGGRKGGRLPKDKTDEETKAPKIEGMTSAADAAKDYLKRI